MTYAREWRTETDPGRELYLRVSCTYIVCGIHVKQTKLKHSQFSVACRQSGVHQTTTPRSTDHTCTTPRAPPSSASRSPPRAPRCAQLCDTRAHKKSTSVELPLRFSETVRRNMAFLKA